MNRWLATIAVAAMLVAGIGCEEQAEVDTTNPVVTIATPADGATLAAGIITIKAVATDDKGVKRVVFFNGRDSLGTSTTATADTFKFDWNATTEPDSSSHDLYATAFDEAGNSAQAAVTVTISATGRRVFTGTLTQDVTIREGDTVILRGGVFVGDATHHATLTIEPGALLLGESESWGMLVISRGSKIMAQGTKEKPIVMTSNKPVGQRARGDWGGLIINGQAPLNTGDEAFGEGGTGYYGGTDPIDNSGVLSYVRVEFAGREISPDNELNGIAFQGVGSGTQIDHVQVHMNADDGIEFFGGTANIKYALITGVADDGFDCTDGWQGKGQFIVVQHANDGAGDNGFECDNNADDNQAQPNSNPTIYNFTMIGAYPTSGGETDIGALLREGMKGRYYNGIIMGWEDGFDIDHEESWKNADSGSLVVDYTILYNNYRNFKEDDSLHNLEAFMTTTMQHNTINPANSPVVDPYNTTSPNFKPQNDALSGALSPTDPWFTPVNFRGGVDPSDDWTAGWTISQPN
jgi:hypothetical protein